jgi:hypothetical protein
MIILKNVLKNDQPCLLCFQSKEDAISFENFIKAYIEKVKPVDNVGVYWLFSDEEPSEVAIRPENAEVSLDRSILVKMAIDITWEIMIENNIDELHSPSAFEYDLQDGLIIFKLAGLLKKFDSNNP